MIDMCVIVRQQVGGEALLRRHLIVAVDRRFDVRSGEKLAGFCGHLAHMMICMQLGSFGREVVEAEEVHRWTIPRQGPSVNSLVAASLSWPSRRQLVEAKPPTQSPREP
jgi:hypothetical protein